MKHFLSLSILAMMVAACSSEEPMPVPDNSAQQQGSVKVTIEEAIKIANQAAEAFDAKSARGVSRRASSAAMVDVLGAKNGRSGGIDTLLYMVNYDNKQGYAIVSASRACETLLGIVDEGEFNALEAAENPSYSYYLANAQNYVASTLGGGISIGGDPITPEYTEVRYDVKDIIPTKLNIRWGPLYPEGDLCPYDYAGCDAVAVAQILSYEKLPASIPLTYEGRTEDLLVLDWDDICRHTISTSTLAEKDIRMHKVTCYATLDAHEVIGKLCREINARCGVQYITYGKTTTVDGMAAALLQTLLPTKQTTNYSLVGSDYETLFESLRSGIGYISGSDITGRHAWVVDGAKHVGYTCTKYWKQVNVITGEQLVTYEDHTTRYFHFNWGYSGQDNGYFKAGVFDPSDGDHEIIWDNPIKHAPSRNNYGTDVKCMIISD